MGGGVAPGGRDGGGAMDPAHSYAYEAACRHCDATPCDPYCHAAPGLYGHATAHGGAFCDGHPGSRRDAVRLSADAARPAPAGRPPRRGARRG